MILVSFSVQGIIDPLQQDRLVTLSGSLKDDHEIYNPKNVAALKLPRGVTNLPMCVPGHPDYFKFLGLTVATLTPENATQTVETPCYSRTKYSLTWVDDLTAKITFTNFLKKNLLCADHYLATTLISVDLHTNWRLLTSSVTYKFKTAEEAAYAKAAGIKIILMCDSWLHMIPDLIKTSALFMTDILGALKINIPPAVRNFFNNCAYDFVQRYVSVTLQPRTEKVPLTVDFLKEHVQSGDTFSVTGPSGTASLIYYGSGGPATHTAIAMRDEQDPSKLWVLEGNPDGLLKIDIDTWWGLYGYMVAWHPLSPANRKIFNPTKAWAWFRSVENLGYGYKNFLFTLVDDPLHNFDYISDVNSIILMFKYLDMISTGIIDISFGHGLNIRLGTLGLTFSDVLYEAQRQGTDIVELLKIPEEDGWIYSDSQQYVCSALAIKMLQEGGLMAGLEINSHEFTPRDVYMIQLYNNDPSALPQECQTNDPGLPFCQVKGQFKFDPTLYNTITPYNHMNEKCPSMAPDFYRPSNC